MLERSIRAMLNCWVQFVVLRETQHNEIYMPLLDATKELMDVICGFIEMNGQDILDVWEQEEFNIDKTVERICAEKNRPSE